MTAVHVEASPVARMKRKRNAGQPSRIAPSDGALRRPVGFIRATGGGTGGFDRAAARP
jgi:hypothetical protein